MAEKIVANAAETTTDEMKNMYLNFNVDNKVYGIEIRYVIQIIGMQEITKMPGMPPDMKGFINLRGNVIPVVSMRLRFGETEGEYSDRTCIIVVQVGEKEVGLIVDAIQETITIKPESISPAPSTGESVSNPCIMGVAQLPNDRVAILIHVSKLFINQE